MLLVTSEQMSSIDRRTIHDFGISAYSLMERAGFAVAQTAIQMIGAMAGRRVEILCGKGNNGGDGFVVGRLLSMQGADVRCILLADRDAVEGAARTHMDLAEHGGVRICAISSPDEIDLLPGTDLIVDAILGTGLKGPPSGLPSEAISRVNNHSAPVLSVDMPSGFLPGMGPPEALGREDRRCVVADRTVTIGLMKMEMATYPGRDWAGQVDVADIGFPAEAIEAEALWLSVPSLREMAMVLPGRRQDAHKGDLGRVAIVAGSPGMTGAACLAAQATMRSGAGMAIVGTPESLMDIMSTKLTEVMVRGLNETDMHTVSTRAIPQIQKLTHWGDVLAIGPGLSRDRETAELVRQVVGESEVPMVVDADGLNAFEGFSGLLAERKSVAVLTPHIQELARLTGAAAVDISRDRVGSARSAAVDMGVTIVLKGAGTVVASPDGKVSMNPNGNPGMATAGSGDVLTGVIAGLMAQGMDTRAAAILGVYIHGLSGDIAADAVGQHSVIAGDLVLHLPTAIRRVAKG